MLKYFIHIILVITLVVQLLPVSMISRHVFDCEEDDYASVINPSKELRQQAEEEHKEFHIHHTWVSVPFISISNAVFHFTENLPITHAGAIPTPPPDCIS